MAMLVTTSASKNQFALCIDSGDYPASLEPWKIYRIVPDRDAQKHDLLRVVDESGEDYLHPRSLFKLVALSAPLRRLYRAKASA
jgi:hypothetical protein